VAHPKTLNLLLAEDNLEDEYLVREALIEIEDNCLWGRWSNCMLTQVDHLHDALDCLQAAPFDAILLNLTLPDSSNLLDTFFRVQAAAAGATVVVLCDEDDPTLATQLVREGAQDVIVKSELECVPLARAIRHGIERSRRLASLHKSVLLDPLTGVQNRFGFLELGSHYLKLARITGTTAAFLLIQFQPAPDENLDLLDLLLIRATEVSRAIFPDGALIGRLRACSLGILAVGVTEEQAEFLAERLRADLYSAFPDAAQPGFVVIESEAGRWSSVEDLLDRPRIADRISGMLSG
jgi:GGDEF domain-containing protein